MDAYRFSAFLLALSLLATSSFAGATDAQAQAVCSNFVANLSSGQEVPPRESSASGTATLVLNPTQTALTFSVTVTGLDFTGRQTADPNDNLVAAHFHAPGPPGTNANVVFGFFGTPFNDNSPNDVVVTPLATGVGGTVTGKWDAAEGNNTTLTAQLPNILAGNAYVNFHTTEFPGGEIRGQIVCANLLGDLSGDRTVNGVDLAIFSQHFGLSGTGLAADLNHDNVVNGLDLAIFSQSFGRTTR